MTTQPEWTEAATYTDFWERLGALLIDGVIFIPYGLLYYWVNERYRFSSLYLLAPGILLTLFYQVYLVGRYGGTPGKLMLKLRIQKLTGEPVGYGGAFVRYLPHLLNSLIITAGFTYGALSITDDEYLSMGLLLRAQRLAEAAPLWYHMWSWIFRVWSLGDIVAFFCNDKRRALHDFIAGTVVIRRTHIVSSESTPVG